jgi:hypothetical protein
MKPTNKNEEQIAQKVNAKGLRYSRCLGRPLAGRHPDGK